jgi:hypothetical protein
MRCYYAATERRQATSDLARLTSGTVVRKQVSGAQKPRLDLLVAYLSLVTTYTSLAITPLG